MKVKAYTNSCVTSVNVKITTVRIPDVDIGIMSLTNAPQRERPSTIAASSRSRGIDLKKPMSSQVEKGMVKLGYTTMIDQSESCRWSSETTFDSGMKRSVGGMR